MGYKNSGIEWIGDIPDDWIVSKLKYNLTEPMKYGATETGVEYQEDLCRYIRITDITGKGQLKEEGMLSLTDAQANGYILKDKSVLFARSGGTVGKSFLYKKEMGKAAFAGYLISANADQQKMLPEWLMYFTDSFSYNEWTNAIFTQATIQNIGADKYSNMEIPIAPIDIQRRIINFLDKKCSDIDKLIRDIDTQIEVLEKYKQSVISEVVTKGLINNRDMKESGIDWVGEIPSSWTVMPNKYVMHKEKTICPIYNGEDILSLTMNGVIIRDLEAGGKMPASFNGYQVLHAGNLLMCLFDIDVTPRCIGYIKNEGLSSPAYSQFVMHENANAEYYYYYYLMVDYTKELLHMAKNLRHSLTEDQLGAIPVPVPPIDEQVEIANYLNKKVNAIDAIIAEKKEQLGIVEQYRKIVVYEYITGKKEVPANA